MRRDPEEGTGIRAAASVAKGRGLFRPKATLKEGGFLVATQREKLRCGAGRPEKEGLFLASKTVGPVFG